MVKKKKVKDTGSERHTNMNRRDFIKSTAVAATIPAISLTCKYEDDEKGPEKEAAWNYRVYCYEREQGEWAFRTNSTGSFAYQREYMTLEEEKESFYHGFMEGGKLHFATLEEAQNFIEHHHQQKDNDSIIDSVYDIYYVDVDNLEYESCQPLEIQVAHYWFNGDTGRQIDWVANKPYTNWNRVECA